MAPPFKRVIRQPKMTTQALLAFDLGESSSSDSDFRIEDEDASSKDDEDDQDDSGDDSSGDDESESAADDSDDSDAPLKRQVSTTEVQINGGDHHLAALLRKSNSKTERAPPPPTKPICCVCLGDRSDDSNEIIECDGCGVSVHEGCYGVSDNASISSTNSTCVTEPWFCEACRAGVSEPTCELCPNKGGIYKETDVGKWVHLVCALYVPGVAFGEVDQLSSVTLFEMQYSKWGAKVCSLCESTRYARTGVCIGCDAGMCKTYFHVTCAQAVGFLMEAHHHEEAEAADPFYAHCKVHSEKEMVKRRRRNFHTFRLNMQQKQEEKLALKLEAPAQIRIQRKLAKYQQKYASHKQEKLEPWVPTQKMSRLLTTSASACKRLLAKAEIMSVDVELLERQEAQIDALTDIRKKWHIAPAFSVEFVGYYIDRISRSKELKQQLAGMMESNGTLLTEQRALRISYDAQLDKNKELKAKQESLLAAVSVLHTQLAGLCPSKSLPSPAHIGRAPPHEPPAKTSTPPMTRPISVPTPAALKMGVGFPLAHLGPPGSKVDASRLLSTHAKNSPSTVPVGASATSAPSTPTLLSTVQSFECGICKRCTDQHMLAKCDTCAHHYHLGCLNPPLSRHPKKSKLYGWQCSECDKSDESDAVPDVPKGPRKARTRFNKDGSIAFALSSDEKDYPPVKRRSVDKVPPLPPKTAAAPHKKVYSDPNEASKKLKLSLNSAPATSNDAELDKFASAHYKKCRPGSAAGTPQPIIHATLIEDEPQVLVLPPLLPTPRIIDLTETDGSADPLALTAPVASIDDITECAKLARKQKRKDKHKSKHSLSSDAERSPNKEHKRKRKKKLHAHDSEQAHDASTSAAALGQTIKIKFKTLPLPGEETPEAQFFYVSADMVRSAEEGSRPTSVETVDDTTPMPLPMGEEIFCSPIKSLLKTPLEQLSPQPPAHTTVTPKGNTPKRKSSPRKSTPKRRAMAGRPRSTATVCAASLICCVCAQLGMAVNCVTCDVCEKHYHFTCLDPPVKKTPKIRGYSWHCADCDPTDEDKK